MTKNGLMACLTTAGFLVAGGAFSATLTSSMNVTANVIDTCTIAVSPMDFGDISPTQPATVETPISIQCNAATILSSVTVSNGQNPDIGSLFGLHRLSDGAGNYIPYELDVGNTVIVNDTVDAFSQFTQAPLSNNWDATLTGTLDEIFSPDPARPVGTYTDVVVITVSYGLAP